MQLAQQRAGGGRQTATDRMQQRLRRRRQAAAQEAEPGSGDEADEARSNRVLIACLSMIMSLHSQETIELIQEVSHLQSVSAQWALCTAHCSSVTRWQACHQMCHRAHEAFLICTGRFAAAGGWIRGRGRCRTSKQAASAASSTRRGASAAGCGAEPPPDQAAGVTKAETMHVLHSAAVRHSITLLFVMHACWPTAQQRLLAIPSKQHD